VERFVDFGVTAGTTGASTPAHQSAAGAITFAMLILAVASWLIWEMLGSSTHERQQVVVREPVLERVMAVPASPVQPVSHTVNAVARPTRTQSFSVLTPAFEVIVDRSPKPVTLPVATNVPTVQPATPPQPPSTPATPPAWEELEHIVVKGDTLWDITRRYIGNPYRYPELARLSQIRNPDLIYPGDRVKIRKKIRGTGRAVSTTARQTDFR